MSNRKLARMICRTGAIVCLIAFCLPGYSVDRTLDRQSTRIQLGLPFSPWLRFVNESRTERGPELSTGAMSTSTSFSNKWNVELFTWSSAALLASIVLFAAARRLRDDSQPVGQVSRPARPSS